MSKLDEIEKKRKEETKYFVFGFCIFISFVALGLAVAIEFSPTIGALVFSIPLLWIGYIGVRGGKDSDDTP